MISSVTPVMVWKVQSLRAVAFNDLPEQVRDKLTTSISAYNRDRQGAVAFAVKPNTRDSLIVRTALLVVGLLGMYGMLASGYGQLGAPGVVQSWGNAVFYTLLIGLCLLLPLTIWPVHQRARLPFSPGIYVFPGDIVDARSSCLDVHSLLGLKAFKATHFKSNGKYTKTLFEFTLADGRKLVYKILDHDIAEQAIVRLRESSNALQAAVSSGDASSVAVLDPFSSMRQGEGPTLPPAPWRRRITAWLIGSTPTVAMAVGLVLAAPVFLARNLLSDRAQFQQAAALDTELGYSQYLLHPLRYEPQAQQGLAPAALREAKKRGTVSALRGVLRRYPKAGFQADVAQQVNIIYGQAFQRFKQQAVQADPTLLPFVQALLDKLENSSDSVVPVRFIRLDTMALAKADQRALLLAPAEKHFGSESAAVREKRIVGELARGFASVFPEDVLKLVRVDSVNPGRPTFEIKYQINPSGVVYKSEKSLSQFIGVIVKFDAQFDVPGISPPWRSKLEVLPPPKFKVNGQSGFLVDDGAVYAEMADRAFDQLAAKLRAAFFASSDGVKR